MPNYDFQTLSPIDFEELARDLLQEELGVRLESFKEGRDGGVDLRYAPTKDSKTIVQCKRFQTTALSRLVSTFKKSELKKIQALKPERYILFTSVGLTPGNKDDLLDLLTPFCKTTGDIYGRDDINGLLAKHSKVQQQHYKLWLTSTAVLERLLNAGIYNFTAADIDSIRQHFSKFVPIETLPRTLQLLEENHYCIITGLPGIGKTTLAHMLLAEYISKNFEVVSLSQNVSEAFPRLHEAVGEKGRRIIFYYDDFLGELALEAKLEKNEDQRLLTLIDAVKRNNHLRFVMTTREYILNQAFQRYERLGRVSNTLIRSAIQMADLSSKTKARILYNHLFFSDLSDEKLQALLRDRTYLSLIQHRNYNPRLIEHICLANNSSSLNPDEYVRHVISAFENPSKVWQHPFRHQIGEECQLLLLVLLTFSRKPQLEYLEAATNRILSTVNKQVNDYQFRELIDRLDGTFVKTNVSSSNPQTSFIEVDFHNPSIRDFLNNEVKDTPSLLKKLIENAAYFAQLVNIWNAEDENGEYLYRKAIQRNCSSQMFSAAEKFASEKLASLEEGGIHVDQRILCTRLRTLREIQQELGTGEYQFLVTVLSQLISALSLIQDTNYKRFNVEAIVELMNEVLKTPTQVGDLESLIVDQLKKLSLWLSQNIKSIENCQLLSAAIKNLADNLSDAQRDQIAQGAERWLQSDVETVLGENYSSEEFESYASDLETCASDLGINMADEQAQLAEKIDEVRSEEEQHEPDDDSDEHGRYSFERAEDSTIDTMFSTLLDR